MVSVLFNRFYRARHRPRDVCASPDALAAVDGRRVAAVAGVDCAAVAAPWRARSPRAEAWKPDVEVVKYLLAGRRRGHDGVRTVAARAASTSRRCATGSTRWLSDNQLRLGGRDTRTKGRDACAGRRRALPRAVRGGAHRLRAGETGPIDGAASRLLETSRAVRATELHGDRRRERRREAAAGALLPCPSRG